MCVNKYGGNDFFAENWFCGILYNDISDKEGVDYIGPVEKKMGDLQLTISRL